MLAAVWRRRRWADVVYLTISQSWAGNLKDLCIYLLCFGRLSRVFVHLHGGAIGKTLFRHGSIARRLNALFLRRVGGVIILGPAHLGVFAGMVEPERLHIVPNGAEDYLFVNEHDIVRKFADTETLRVLYLSGMTRQKGYLDLLNGWLSLGPEVRRRVQLDFAGRFDSDSEQAAFLHRIAQAEGARYHGTVEGTAKKALLAQAHILCLPTRMSEGQPICILEAYASGCVVVTTGQPGIRDIFTDRVNGLQLEQESTTSIAAVLSEAAEASPHLREMALANRRTAGRCYRADTSAGALARILEQGDHDGSR